MSIFAFIRSALSSLTGNPSMGFDAQAEASRWSGQRESFGPSFNVDGTPMLDSCVDVFGRAYGDHGCMFSHDTFDPCSDTFQSHDL